MSYLVFEAVFKDDCSVIVPFTYPCSIPHYYGLSSEVATVDFLRTCSLPAPRAHKWDATVSNLVGSVFMVMENISPKFSFPLVVASAISEA